MEVFVWGLITLDVLVLLFPNSARLDASRSETWLLTGVFIFVWILWFYCVVLILVVVYLVWVQIVLFFLVSCCTLLSSFFWYIQEKDNSIKQIWFDLIKRSLSTNFSSGNYWSFFQWLHVVKVCFGSTLVSFWGPQVFFYLLIGKYD